MKTLVTGTAGALGSHMAERLKRDGFEVSGVDAFTDYYDPAEKRRTAEELLAQGIETVEADLSDCDLSVVVPNDTEFIIHFAGQPGISSAVSFETYEKNNLIATKRLIERARQLESLKGFLYISTSSTYGAQAVGDESSEPKPTSFYGVTKLASEQLVLSYARRGLLPAAATRLFSVYGERERPDKLYRKLIAAIDGEMPFPLHEGSREHRRSYTYVGDIIDGIRLMMDRWDACVGEIFNLGTDVSHTTGEGIDLVEKLMGKKGIYTLMPPRPGDQKETAANIGKARAVLGYVPSTSLEEGLAREIAWFRAHKS